MTDQQLECRSLVADAKLGVAEELGWFVAFFGAVIVHLKFDSWWYTIPAFAAGYYLITYPYRKPAALAEDEYYRQAGLGKYSRARNAVEEE